MNISGLIFFAGVTMAALDSQPARQPLRTVPQVDYARYSGTWYEIARLPFRFQKDCASDVTANYAPRSDGRITVTNRCLRTDGEVMQAKGVARHEEGKPTSVLKVRFAPAFLSFIPAVWGDYQIIALGADYDYAVVGTPDRRWMWILSRTPVMEPSLYSRLKEQAKAQGFDVDRLIETRHTPKR
jgi:apolipoprotein D and lipocalin family protein